MHHFLVLESVRSTHKILFFHVQVAVLEREDHVSYLELEFILIPSTVLDLVHSE